MFEGIFINLFDKGNQSNHPLDFASGVMTPPAIKESPLKALHKGSQVSINVTNKHLIPSENNMPLKAAYSVTMNIFENIYFLFKSFVKVKLSYVFTIKMFSTAENCTEK